MTLCIDMPDLMYLPLLLLLFVLFLVVVVSLKNQFKKSAISHRPWQRGVGGRG